MKTTIELPPFQNEPALDFSKPEVNARIEAEIKRVRNSFGKEYPLLISGQSWYTPKKIRRENPSCITETVGWVCKATPEHADEAIGRMQESKDVRAWMGASHRERACHLRKAAQILRWRKEFFIALMVLETGKTRKEAAGEVCEAIDFLVWYANMAEFLAELNQGVLSSPKGERNEGHYVPIGIGVSIQPWNFPLAISTGPAAAGLVMGNPVIYKPAEQSSIIGYHLSQAFYDAGIPKDVFHFLPGVGEEVGSYLVGHPAVRWIAFTGSREVGRIIKRQIFEFNDQVDSLPPQDRYEKKLIAELGGKNPLIIDSDADPDVAALAAWDSGFSHQGQKCSAESRLIIVDEERCLRHGLYGTVVRRLTERIDSVNIGPPEDPKNMFGPLISNEAYEEVKRYMWLASQEGRVLARGNLPKELTNDVGSPQGYFLPPMLVEVPPGSRVAQEEIFGPVLAVFRVRNLDEALALAKHTWSGLTGGVVSRNEDHIARVIAELPFGNIAINDKIVGSIVGRQPFGEIFGAKAGGWDYLLQFTHRKNVRRNTMQYGIDVS